jgi:hypothetical protein
MTFPSYYGCVAKLGGFVLDIWIVLFSKGVDNSGGTMPSYEDLTCVEVALLGVFFFGQLPPPLHYPF